MILEKTIVLITVGSFITAIAQIPTIDPTDWSSTGGILGLIILAFFVLFGIALQWLLKHVTKLTEEMNEERKEFAAIATQCSQNTISSCREIASANQQAINELSGEVRTLNQILTTDVASKIK